MPTTKILVAGLPDTGKTTFIAALWYYVCATYAGNKSISLNSLTNGEDEYLNNIRKYWASYEPVPRTTSSLSGTRITMNLVNSLNAKPIILEIPDFSGETFAAHFETREWQVEYNNLINEINGLLLFLSPLKNNNTPSLLSIATEIESSFDEPAPIFDGSKPNPWSPDTASNQVKLVETLQFLEYYRQSDSPLKLSVVISAWDTVQQHYQDINPEGWLKTNLPLLSQYLRSNSHYFQCKYFGISAQGCDYSNTTILEKLDNKEPIERISVIEDNSTSNDIGRPILWITE